MPSVGPREVLACCLLAAACGRSAAAPRVALPIVLSGGWEAADGDPVDGVRGLNRLTWRPADPVRDLAPRDAVRWYRVRLNLAGRRAETLAFVATAIRDVDETYFDGVRIGGLGSFPPRIDRATGIARLYPIPGYLFEQPGVRYLTLRVYHGKRSGSVFRFAPRVDNLHAVANERSRLDQSLAFFGGISLTIAIVLYLFAFQARRLREYPLFATFSILLGGFALTLHSGWSTWPVSRELPFRLGTALPSLMTVCYLWSLCGLARVEPPRRFRLYAAWLVPVAVIAALAPDPELAVVPARANPYVILIALLDLLLVLARETLQDRPGLFPALVGHVLFVAGAGLLTDLPTVALGSPLPHGWAIPFLAVGFLLLAMNFLWAMADQVSRFRLGALTDPGTRLWNRQALFEEISARIELHGRGRGENGSTFGLIVVDLDRFKEWNDRMGHLAGDRMLVQVARALQDVSRPGDLVARYGGDEFGVVLEKVDLSTAQIIAARFHEAVVRSIREMEGRPAVTASLGVAVYQPGRHASASSLFHDADRALYEAKEAGRDRIVLFTGRLSESRSRSGELTRKSGDLLGIRKKASDEVPRVG